MRYYLLKATDKGWITYNIFSDYEYLIAHLASYQSGVVDYSEGKPYYNNWLLDKISMNFQDEYVTSDWFGETHKYTRPWVLMDEENRIVDPRLFYEDINNAADGGI